MRRTRQLIGAMTATTFAIVILAAPASADDGVLAFISGIPGKAIDVCIDGREVISELRYGQAEAWAIEPGPTTVKVAISARGRCQGRTLQQDVGTVLPGLDSTWAFAARAPGVLWWDNATLGVLPAVPTLGGAPFVLRNASDLRGGVVWSRFLTFPVLMATENPTLNKGQEVPFTDWPGNALFAHVVSRPGRFEPLFGPMYDTLAPDTRTEYYVVGTTSRNARLVRLVRPVRLPSVM